MKWKKVCAAALCLAMAGSLAACGGSSGSAANSPKCRTYAF